MVACGGTKTEMIGPSIGLQEDTEQVHEWLKKCRVDHICHKERDPTFVPTRLIDIGPIENPLPRISLVAKDDVPPRSVYLTLSHSWGQLQTLLLTKDRFQSMVTEIVFGDLDKTFRDAITLVKTLGFRYIWIDSLCIIQDSDDDWQIESSKMDLVYSNALFNIAATAAEDGSAGLLADRDFVSTQSVVVIIPRYSSEPQLLMYHSVDGLLEKGPLNARGWVVQERLLSRANLHFTSIQVYWECSESLACEAVPNYNIVQESGILEAKRAISRALSDKAVKLTPKQIKADLALWIKISSLYSGCQLTRQTDKLIAIGGIARIFAKMVDCRYLAGLWQENLMEHMCWCAHEYGNGRNFIGCREDPYLDCAASTELRIPYRYIAPSWSWASSETRIKQLIDPSSGAQVYNIAELVAVPVMLTLNSNRYGQVKDGSIRVAGRLALARWHRGESKIVLISSNKEQQHAFRSPHLKDPIGLPSDGQSNIGSSHVSRGDRGIVYFLPLIGTNYNVLPLVGSSCGIILRPVRGVPFHFTRCGSYEHTLPLPTSKFAKALDYFDTVSEAFGFSSILNDQGSRRYQVTII
jgi:hypothetical protein